MVRGRRLRRAYDRVSEDDGNAVAGEENEVFVDEEEEDVEAPRRAGRRRQYQTVSTAAEEDDDKATAATDNEEDEDDEDEEDGTKVTIVILDPAQKKFHIPAYTHWTIAQFKERGERVHKVTPPSQRLIYRGQLLLDNKTLEEVGITTDKLIVHLFPKPRVVIQQSNNNSSSCTAAGGGEDEEGAGGAHIPQIVLNPDEAEQRSHILVLGSTDFIEAQNNVKLFSFLLLVISSIELFNLILILMGVPPDTDTSNDAYSAEDDFFYRHDHEDNGTNSMNPYDPYGSSSVQQDPYQEQAIQQELQTWHPRNNIDLVISGVGVYVALLGIRATNETTLLLAQQYLAGTVVVGIAWMMFNYWFTVHVDEEFDELRRDERHNNTGHNSTDAPVIYDDDAIPYKTEWEYYQQNLSLMMIPGMVWLLCCVRAWQFQSLLEEAEREAQDRHREQETAIANNINNANAPAAAEEESGEGEDTPDVDRQNTATTSAVIV